jgi:hypothetical protein
MGCSSEPTTRVATDLNLGVLSLALGVSSVESEILLNSSGPSTIFGEAPGPSDMNIGAATPG